MVAGEWINGNLQEVYGAEEREGPTRKGMVDHLAGDPKRLCTQATHRELKLRL